ncbi:MAG: sugar phosphate isomerase/epimerase [Deltaproteobacteria bacterium]|nr:sugar phosphate isomerase/epimerase [Deltaproteobacteria bacterium]
MVGINTNYKNDTSNIEAIEDQLRNIADTGFSHVEWGHDWLGDYIYSNIEMVQIKKLLSQHNLKMKAIHATEGRVKDLSENDKFDFGYPIKTRKDYTSLNEYTRLAGVDLIQNRVDLAYITGAKAIVLHMQLPYIELLKNKDFKKKYWQQVLKSFDELRSYCKTRDVKIAVENLLCTPLQKQVDQFDKLFARYDFDFMGFCFDSGHAVLVSPDDHLFFAKRYKNRITALHLQDTNPIAPQLIDDNLAVLKHDKHAIPFTGVVNWDELTRIIAQSPYELPVTLEINIKAETYEEEMSNLKEAFVNAKKLNEMVTRYKNIQ